MELTQLKTLTMVLVISPVHTAAIKPDRFYQMDSQVINCKACDGIMSPEDFQEGPNSQK